MVPILVESLYGTTMARGPGQQPEDARGGDGRRADHRPAHHRPLAEQRRRTWAIAATGGYAPAPLPAGALEIGGVYLARTSRGFRARCHQVADRLGFAVPCPGLLPTAAPGSPP